jgi:hypothetical protein
MSHKVQGRSGRIHKEGPLLPRRMPGPGDGTKALWRLPILPAAYETIFPSGQAMVLPIVAHFAGRTRSPCTANRDGEDSHRVANGCYGKSARVAHRAVMERDRLGSKTRTSSGRRSAFSRGVIRPTGLPSQAQLRRPSLDRLSPPRRAPLMWYSACTPGSGFVPAKTFIGPIIPFVSLCSAFPWARMNK